MILQALVKYYEELVQQGKAAKPGWCQAKVSHAIELNADGTIKTIISLKRAKRQEESMGSRTFKCTGNGYKIFRDCF